MTHTQRVPSNITWGYFGRKRAEREEAALHEQHAMSAKAIVEAQWRIVDALEELPFEGQKAAVRMALQTLDIAAGATGELLE